MRAVKNLCVGSIGDTVLPGNWQKKEKTVRRLAGWKVWSDLVEPNTPPDDLPDWPQNALRHTHASMFVALGKPLEKLIFEFGHSGGVRMLKSHYVGVMPKSEALKIMKIAPRGRGPKELSAEAICLGAHEAGGHAKPKRARKPEIVKPGR